MYFAEKRWRKIALVAFLFGYSLVSLAQARIASTDQFSIEQDGNGVAVGAMDDLVGFEVKNIGDVRTFNSKREEKSIRKNVKAIC